jgi:hypothetical protein
MFALREIAIISKLKIYLLSTSANLEATNKRLLELKDETILSENEKKEITEKTVSWIQDTCTISVINYMYKTLYGIELKSEIKKYEVEVE